jgi:hypothetical protein
MKKHFRTLFDAAHRWRTIIMIALGILFLAGAGIVDITDNPPGIALFYAGTVTLIVSMIYIWQEPKSWLMFSGLCAGVIALVFISLQIWAIFFLTAGQPNTPSQGEGILEAILFILILFICLPGIFIGFVGAIIRGLKKK